MELHSALELKTNLVALARDAVVRRTVRAAESAVSSRMNFAFAARAGAIERPPIGGGGVAFGVAPSGKRTRKPDYRLAVRVLGQSSVATESIMGSMPRLSDDEIDIARGITYEPRLLLLAGGSIGHFRITAGTLGAFVEDDDEYYILSNNHVLANSDSCRKGDPIWSPGPVDVGSKSKVVVGELDRWIPLSNSKTNGVDAALATMTDEVDEFEPWEYRGIGDMTPKPFTDRYAVGTVVKKGRTTKVTEGTVSAFSLDGVAVNYGTAAAPWIVTFDDQLEFIGTNPAKPFSQGGDSGSLIMDKAARRPVALLYGGGPDNQGIDRTVAHFIPDVLSALGVRFVQ